MIIRCEELQKVCSKILVAVDTNNNSIVTETLEMYTENNYFYMSITNREYFVKVRLDIQNDIEFNATVSADVFLKLISKMTTETIEFSTKDNFLIVKGNGVYKLPMIYEGDTLLKLPEIIINNVTTKFDVDKHILSSIITYNSKELNKKHVVSNPVQNMYFIDEKGCITFTTGACVNKFILPTPIKILLSDKIVKLFKLFSSDSVHVDYGKDSLSNGMFQYKIKFYTDDIELTAIINSDDNMINSVPENAIRKRAFDTYDYSVVINKKMFINAIDRILLFVNNTLGFYGKFNFTKDKLILSNDTGDNSEILTYENSVENLTSYDAVFDLADLKLTISEIKSDYITMSFGDGQAAVIIDSNIYNIIPECVV